MVFRILELITNCKQSSFKVFPRLRKIMKLPLRISPCPIIDSVIEARFETGLPDDAIFGLFFGQFRSDFPRFEKLPVAQLPDEVKQNDPNLKFSPYFQARSEGFVLRFGPRVISLSNPVDYVGWEKYFAKFKKLFADFNRLETEKRFCRVGVRYIDHFKFDIFPRIKMKISLQDRELAEIPKAFSCQLNRSGISSNLQIANNIALVIEEKTASGGSIIDIDSFIDFPENSTPEQILQTIETCHQIDKEHFFSLLNEDFLAQLCPEYAP